MKDKQNESSTTKLYVILMIIGFSVSFISGLYGVINEISTNNEVGILLIIGFVGGIAMGFLGMSKGIFPELNQPEVSY